MKCLKCGKLRFVEVVSKDDVMLKPLIEELKQLWQGVEAYDYDQKQKFNL
jgi:hypothetical protein